MNVKSVEKLEKSQVAVTVEVTAEEFEAAVQKAYLKMRNKISVPGFRPGKAPRKMIEKLYGEGVFYSDAVDAALPDAYTQAIGSSGLDVVGYPRSRSWTIRSARTASPSRRSSRSIPRSSWASTRA